MVHNSGAPTCRGENRGVGGQLESAVGSGHQMWGSSLVTLARVSQNLPTRMVVVADLRESGFLPQSAWDSSRWVHVCQKFRCISPFVGNITTDRDQVIKVRKYVQHGAGCQCHVGGGREAWVLAVLLPDLSRVCACVHLFYRIQVISIDFM